ncbi:hypothetical protein [Runella sp.]|uniref:hypothetical protein n=1 Tax=Runella sp. TaxID=1960881 RepID=UPI003D150AB5
MKMVLFAVSMTALLTCSDTSVEQEMSATLGYSNECGLSEKANCQAHSGKVSVKDIPPVGCAIPLGQVAEMIEKNAHSAQKQQDQ